jgi:hypothetical protein
VGLGYPGGLQVFAVVTDFVFAKDAIVAKGLFLLHRRADANDAYVFPPHPARLVVQV